MTPFASVSSTQMSDRVSAYSSLLHLVYGSQMRDALKSKDHASFERASQTRDLMNRVDLARTFARCVSR
jgi:hypothetical protein